MNVYSIREVCMYTGVNPITLRAWESRYGIINPARTEGGHRLYSKDDIKRIKAIQFFKSRGYALKEIPSMLTKLAQIQSDLYHYTIPNLIEGIKSFNALKVQKELQLILSKQYVEIFADQTLPDILKSLKDSLWAKSIYFTQERCFFYDQLRFQLQSSLYQSIVSERPIQIKIVGYQAPREISEFYVHIYLLALLCSQYNFSVCVISHIDSFEELQVSCTTHGNILHIVPVGCDAYKLQQLAARCLHNAIPNLLFSHPALGEINTHANEMRCLLPRKFENIAFRINQQMSYTK